MSRPTSFPSTFLWGASTAAYQIEGSPLADGAGPSIWHRFSHTPGMTLGGDTGDVACDHYRRWRDDVRLMKDLGLKGYRFSIAWARVFPEGTGKVNQKGLDFYRGLVDALGEAGIVPMATLYHWDLPAALHDRGGWLNRDVAGWFGEYAGTMFRALDDRVTFWATLNEPWVVTDGGYLNGGLAPGHRSPFEAAIAMHNLMRAHGEAVGIYRAEGKNEIGLVVNLEPKVPASEKPEDFEATRRTHAYMNRQYLDAVFKGRYPEEMKDVLGAGWPESFPAADFEGITRKIDFLGVNYYARGVMAADPSVPYERARRVVQPRSQYTMMNWEVHHPALTDVLVWVKNEYGDVPLYITENGAAFYDPPSPVAGKIEDPLRIDYLRNHIGAVGRAIEQGVDVRGYFVWSFLDNFEWSQGYARRFGIVHVDYATQKRTPKSSAAFYAGVIKANGKGIDD